MTRYRPLVTCVVPIYNAEKYLDQGVRSLLAQTYDNVEIILVDDWSSDASWDICQQFATDNRNVIALRTDERAGGPLRGREKGIREAHGDWITFMDGDDYVGPEYIEHLLEVTHNGKFDIAVTGHVRLHPDGKIEEFLWDNYSQTTKERMSSFYKHYFLDQDYWTDPADTVGQNLIRASVAKKTDLSKYPNVVYGEDSLMALAFVGNSKNGVNFVDYHDFYWRQIEGSGSHGGFSTTANRPELYRGLYEILQHNHLLPLVSIIVPIYNVEHYLQDCIDSLLTQTYPNLEIILVDDKSPDQSGRIADEYASRDGRVKVIHKQKNEGLNMARAIGFKSSTGQYLQFVDSDDLLAKDCIEITLRTLLKDKTDFVRFSMLTFKDKTDLSKKRASPNEEKHIVLRGKKDLYLTQFDQRQTIGDLSMFSMTVCGVLYARRSVNKIDWRDTNYRAYEDNIWTLRFLENVTSGTFLSYMGYYYRFDDSIKGALNKSLVGNTLNGKPIGYMECWTYIWNEYRRYNKKYNIGADEIVEKMIRHLYTFRASHLTEANLWGAENNADYLLETIGMYQKRLEDIQQENAAKETYIYNLETENAHIRSELSSARAELGSHMSVKRSARLTLGNIKRRVDRHKKGRT